MEARIGTAWSYLLQRSRAFTAVKSFNLDRGALPQAHIDIAPLAPNASGITDPGYNVNVEASEHCSQHRRCRCRFNEKARWGL